MRKVDKIFVDNLVDIISNGSWDENPRPKYEDGTPAHTKFITDVYEKYQPEEVPITVLRPISYKLALEEIFWIMQDQTSDLSVLEARGPKWWGQWALEEEEGEARNIGERYGKTISNYNMVNRVLTQLKDNPFGRRAIINMWQETDLQQYAKLPPCAFQTMWSVRPDLTGEYKYVLDCSLTQRSSDYLTAGHINLIQYKALQMMFAKHLGYGVGTFSRHTMNLHVYDRHMKQLTDIVGRAQEYTIQETEPIFKLNVPDGTNFYDTKTSDFTLENYHPVKKQLKFELGI